MKSKHSYLVLCLLLSLLAIWSCKKEDVTSDTGSTSTPETSLTFTCKDTLGIPDILLGIAPQEVDRDAGNFLRSGTTDNLGKVKFNNLEPQKFYYSATRSVNGVITKRTGSVIVNQDQKKLVTVTF